MTAATGRTVAAMGTVVTVRVIDADTPRAADAIDRALGWIRVVERTCSHFDPNSELQQLCARPGVAVPVSDLLFRAVAFACEVASRTQGAFDPTAGHDAAGSWRDIHCDADARTVTLSRPLRLDLGAVAKGMAADLAARALAPCTNFMVDAGGDVVVGGHGPSGGPWRVGLRDPLVTGTHFEALEVTEGAVCTSGTYERGSHIVDARTGQPATSCASVTVCAPTALVADALATAAFILGPDEGARLLADEGVMGLIVDRHRHVQRVELAARA